MAATDVRRAVRYLVLALLLYAVLAIGLGRGVRPLEIAIFLLGVAALVIAAGRLQD